jgi:transmembrane sensor
MAVPRRADLASVTAWTERRLILVDRPLYEVIEEFNLYSRQRLVIEDPSIRDMRISINFQTDTVQIFGASLAAASGLKVIQQTDGAWLIQR